jgi:hypothetical protein
MIQTNIDAMFLLIGRFGLPIGNLNTTQAERDDPTFSDFNKTLIEMNAFIAGGAALMAYVKDIHGYKGDLDIWMPISNESSIKSATHFFVTYLGKYGYSESYREDFQKIREKKMENRKRKLEEKEKRIKGESYVQYMKRKFELSKLYNDETTEYLDAVVELQKEFLPDSTTSNSTIGDYEENPRFLEIISDIKEFRGGEQGEKVIQLIFTHVDKLTVLNSFDLSFCATSWDGREFYNIDPEKTLRKVGYRLNPRAFNREQLRERKYTSRGFRIFDATGTVEEKYETPVVTKQERIKTKARARSSGQSNSSPSGKRFKSNIEEEEFDYDDTEEQDYEDENMEE